MRPLRSLSLWSRTDYRGHLSPCLSLRLTQNPKRQRVLFLTLLIICSIAFDKCSGAQMCNTGFYLSTFSSWRTLKLGTRKSVNTCGCIVSKCGVALSLFFFFCPFVPRIYSDLLLYGVETVGRSSKGEVLVIHSSRKLRGLFNRKHWCDNSRE